ncbi:hypothetical protein PENTCL1PPCAC_5737, partial [Pristionchus entomophagus]
MRLYVALLFAIANLNESAKDRVQKEEMTELLKYTSIFEVAQIIGEEYRQKYPEIFDKDDLTAFKKELLDFFILEPGQIDEVLYGKHDRFSVMFVKLRAMEPVVEKQFNELDQEDKDYYLDKEIYLKYLFVVEPLVMLVREKKADYERRGLSEKEIKREINDNVMRLHNRWFGQTDE